MTLDLKAISRDPMRLLVFFLLLLIVRGLPSLLVYRRPLPVRQRVEMTFITATTLPLLIALVEIGQQTGSCSRQCRRPGRRGRTVGPGVPPRRGAAAPVGAAPPADVGISAADAAAGTSGPPDTAPNG